MTRSAPSSLSATRRAEEPGAERLVALDGLRGIAALAVLLSHLALTLAPISDVWIRPGPVHPPVWSMSWWLTSTPLQLAVAGPEAVLVFFVLSGLVVSLPVLRRADFDWMAYYPRRLLRLWLPTAGAILFALLLITVVDQSRPDQSSLWVKASAIHQPPLSMIVSTFDLLFGSTALDNPLWTIHWEVVFSILLPAFVGVAVLTRRWWWATLLGTVPLVVAGNVLGLTPLMFLPVFLVGCVFAVKLDGVLAWAARHRGRVWFTIAGIGVTVLSGLLLGLHWATWAVLGGPPHAQSASTGVEYVGAAGLVLVAIVWTPAIRLLTTRVVRWLGRISFSLYLVHVPIILMVASLFGRSQPALRLIVSFVLALVVAELFTRFVEGPSHRFSRWCGARVTDGMRRLRERGATVDVHR